jgi:hypothetical protein
MVKRPYALMQTPLQNVNLHFPHPLTSEMLHRLDSSDIRKILKGNGTSGSNPTATRRNEIKRIMGKPHLH